MWCHKRCTEEPTAPQYDATLRYCHNIAPGKQRVLIPGKASDKPPVLVERCLPSRLALTKKLFIRCHAIYCTPVCPEAVCCSPPSRESTQARDALGSQNNSQYLGKKSEECNFDAAERDGRASNAAAAPQKEKDRSAVTEEDFLPRGCLPRTCPEPLLLVVAAAAASWPAASRARRLSGRSFSDRLPLPAALGELMLPASP